MKKICLIISMVGLLILSGCASISDNDVKTDSMNTNSDNPSAMINSGLPTKELTVHSGNKLHRLQVEIASTDQQRKIGLMNRLNMDMDKGMLFVFDQQGYLYFWMKNTLFPLDILFIDQDGIIDNIASKVLPCTTVRDQDCLKISSVKPTKYTLEINAGLADKLGIKVGDKVSW